MTELKNKCTRLKIVAIILAAIAVVLLVTSFLTPPKWYIDGSVIAAVGEIFAFASLFFAWEATDRGLDAKIKHGQTEIELNNPD
jgi:drug/metabolite transporter superfamily protein YnfA